MNLEEYLADLSHPVAYFRVDKSVVNKKLEFFTKMFELKVSTTMAIFLMNSGIEEYI